LIDYLVAYFVRVPLAGLMLVVTLGYLLGRANFRGFIAGPGGGTLAVALLFGWLGLSLENLYGGVQPALTVGRFGFALFIYSVGFDAGPQFISCLRSSLGWKYVAVGSSVVVSAILFALGAAAVFGFDPATAAGVLAGGLSSTAAFAAASGEVPDTARLSVAFAITYPFGLAGVIAMIQTLPRVTRTDLSRGAISESEQTDSSGRTRVYRSRTPELTRAFVVEKQDVAGRQLKELDLSKRTGCFISRIHRGDEVLMANAAATLQLNDHLLVVGRLDELQKFEELVGSEVFDAQLREQLPAPRRVVVTSRSVHAKTLKDLNLLQRFHCIIGKIERGREVIEPGADVELLRHDVVEVIGQRDAVREVARELGRFEPSTHATDIAIYAGGIVFGLVIGSIHFAPVGLDFSLGAASGLLLSGVLLSWARQFSAISANVPRAARQLVRELGVLLFVGETGLAAGYALRSGMDFTVWQVLVSGSVVTIVPVCVALVLGKLVLKMRPVDIWGSLCGGMTSSSALNAVKRAADSEEPAVSFAAAFAVASILVTIAGQVVVRVLA
jgi:putative transport protein